MPSKAKLLARASLAAAAGVTALYLGAVVPTARLSLLCVATLGVTLVKMNCGGWWPLGCYAVTSLLSLLLLPDKTPAALYALFMGYYPLVKLRAERIDKPAVRWAVKLGVFHAAAAVLYLLIRSALFPAAAAAETAWWILWAGGVCFFLVYDFVLGQLILYYLRRIAGRIK